jgi:hypothetical protein
VIWSGPRSAVGGRGLLDAQTRSVPGIGGIALLANRLSPMPLRRHPVPHVQETILRSATGPQLVKARTLAERDARSERLNAEERAHAAAWCDLLNREIARRVRDDAPEAIFML